MTEKLQPLSTQIAIPSQILSATPIPVSTYDVPHKVEAVEEEPYTIRCICNFSDDDGNTIYCETCDTWQHIDCYYPDNREEVSREDFAHSCVHCKPRPLDKQRAIDRTQQLRSVLLPETIDRKHAKRPPSKSHKKKPKPTDLLLNGNHPSQDAPKHPSPNDHQPHPPKKAKHSHKPSQSASQAAKRSPSYPNSRTQPNGHPPSPANTPPDLPSDFQIHHYSQAFLSLYNESDVKIVESNSYAKINVLNSMARWLREPEVMRADTGHTYSEVFRSMPADFDSKRPQIRVEDKRAPAPLTSGAVLHWKNLTTPTPVDKNMPLIELNGQIGIQKEYCDDPNNMWADLSSPLPFVFFHPDIPLYIDTRREGSQARYVRRSCKPNATLETFISGGSDYHFWLVSDQYIGAGDQITLPWDFRFPRKERVRYLQLIDLGDEETKGGDEPDMDETEYLNLGNWVHRILSEYGGCACDLGNNCAFARFHRRYHARVLARAAQAKKRSRKSKPHNTISPTSTGQATNSRAPSEGRMDDAADDARSTSGSSHSKAPSRDATPAPRQGSFDTFTGILTEPTGRDKRKVAMLEDQFRALEQPKPKKKRVSDGSSSSKPKSRNPANGRTLLTNGTGFYADAGTSRSKSGSPASAISPAGTQLPKPMPTRHEAGSSRSRQTSAAPNPLYVDVAVQTDPTEGTWYSPCRPAPIKSRRIISLSKRLLESRYKARSEDEGRRTSQSSVAESATAMDIDSIAGDVKPCLGSPHESEKHMPLASPGSSVAGDVVMTDGVVPSPVGSRLPPPVMLAPPTPLATSPIKKSPDLRVQMPPIPVFNGTGTVTTPMSATGSVVQSPFSVNILTSPFTPTGPNGTAPHQSPIRKKLSLSDYKKSKLDKSAAGRTLKQSTSSLEENKPLLDSIVDSPTGEKAAEAMLSTNATT